MASFPTTMEDGHMDAVKLERFGMIAFGPEFPDDLRGPVREDLGGEVVEGVELDSYADGPIDWPDLALWPEGTEAPEQVLCVSKADPRHYRVYKHSHNIDKSKFEITGDSFTLMGSVSAWRVFVETLRSLDRNARNIDPRETEEAWDEVLENLAGGRTSPVAGGGGR